MDKFIRRYVYFLAVAMLSLVLLVGNSRDTLAAYEGGDVFRIDANLVDVGEVEPSTDGSGG